MNSFAEVEKSILGVSGRTLSTALIGGLGTYYLVPNAKGFVELAGMNVPSYVIYAAAFGLAGASNEVVRDLMKKYTPRTAWLYEFSPISTGITAVGFMYVFSLLSGGDYIPSMQQILYPFAVGAIADYSGMLLTDSIVNPLMSIKKVSDVSRSLLPESHILEELPMNLNQITDGLIMF